MNYLPDTAPPESHVVLNELMRLFGPHSDDEPSLSTEASYVILMFLLAAGAYRESISENRGVGLWTVGAAVNLPSGPPGQTLAFVAPPCEGHVLTGEMRLAVFALMHARKESMPIRAAQLLFKLCLDDNDFSNSLRLHKWLTAMGAPLHPDSAEEAG